MPVHKHTHRTVHIYRLGGSRKTESVVVSPPGSPELYNHIRGRNVRDRAGRLDGNEIEKCEPNGKRNACIAESKATPSCRVRPQRPPTRLSSGKINMADCGRRALARSPSPCYGKAEEGRKLVMVLCVLSDWMSFQGTLCTVSSAQRSGAFPRTCDERAVHEWQDLTSNA